MFSVTKPFKISFLLFSYPPHELDVPEFSISWLYTELADFYKSWLPESEQEIFYNSFSEMGYYTIKIKPDLRIVMVNPNGCLSYNL